MNETRILRRQAGPGRRAWQETPGAGRQQRLGLLRTQRALAGTLPRRDDSLVTSHRHKMVLVPGEVRDMPGLSSGGIFLSYRRQDAARYARLLKSQLSDRFPDADVFMDLDSIEAGLDFAEVIRDAVGSCPVLVALIGHRWATVTDEEGHRRLDNLDDYVRFEVQTALVRGVRVIPVLVDGAKPLRQQQLPSELQKLARLNALELTYGRYDYDANRLLDTIQRVLAAAADSIDQSSLPRDVEAAVVPRPEVARPGGNVPDVAGPESARDGDARAARLLSDAERIAQSITPDPEKAGRLLTSRRRWQPPTRTARNASPARSPSPGTGRLLTR